MMRKKQIFVLIVLIMLSTAGFSHSASWQLYDDFNSGSLDSAKWNNGSTVSAVTVENGKLKIDHNAGNPGKSGYITLLENPENIYGLKASVTISSCTGDVRARIAANPGEIGAGYVWTALQFQQGQNRIYSFSAIYGDPPDTDLHFGAFKNPIDLIGNTYIGTVEFLDNDFNYEVDGLGKITYSNITPLDSRNNTWRALGSRSTNGDGPCTIWFDDVYVLRK